MLHVTVVMTMPIDARFYKLRRSPQGPRRAPAWGLLLLLLLSACGVSQGAPTLPTVTPTPRPPTATPTPLPPTATPTPTITPTPTPLVTAPERGVPQHRMSITLNYADRRIEVGHTVRLHNPTQAAWDEVVLAVPPAHQGLFALRVAEVTTRWHRRAVSATLKGTMLHVPAPVPVGPGEPVAIYLSYALDVPPVDPYAWLPLGNLGAGERLIQAGDWHPTLVPYRPGTGWQTWDYHLVGDPNIYPVADYDVELLADPAVVIAAPGHATQEGQVRRYRIEDARAFAFLASPEYKVIHGTAGATPVHAYYLPGAGEGAQAVVEAAAQAIPLYEEVYGPYPHAGLVIAQNAYYGGMEYSGLISMSGHAYRAYDGSPVSLLVDLTVHEIAHQWWYSAVGNDQVHDPWLDEAFAKYSELLFYERYYPEYTDWWWQNHIYTRDLSGPLDSTIYEFPSTPAYIDRVYAQGARFLGDLRALMGDEAFFAFTRAYREANEGRLVTREDFFEAVRDHTSEDLTPLIESYFATP
jgi:hypothetical protein